LVGMGLYKSAFFPLKELYLLKKITRKQFTRNLREFAPLCSPDHGAGRAVPVSRPWPGPHSQHGAIPLTTDLVFFASSKRRGQECSATLSGDLQYHFAGHSQERCGNACGRFQHRGGLSARRDRRVAHLDWNRRASGAGEYHGKIRPSRLPSVIEARVFQNPDSPKNVRGGHVSFVF
jgi:hypothetical protein